MTCEKYTCRNTNSQLYNTGSILFLYDVTVYIKYKFHKNLLDSFT
jgi:hypothetical protein